MVYSKTGYGKAEAQLRDKNILLEIKSLNSKNLDISVRLPNEIREIELGLRKIISENLLRGKIDLFVTIEDCSNNQSKSINSTVVNDYINQLRDIYPGDEIELLKLAIKLPNTIANKKEVNGKKVIDSIDHVTPPFIFINQ